MMDRIDLALRLLAERDQAVEELACLTAQQTQAVALLCKGFDMDEIGDHMGIGGPTVKSYLARAAVRLKVNRVELIVLGAKAGLA